MSHIHLTKQFTTDARDDDVVSIALVVSEEPDELWRRAFDALVTDLDWLPGNDGVIVGYSFPFAYDGTTAIEIRTHPSTINQALTAVAAIIDRTNDERTQAATHNPKLLSDAERAVQAWFDRS